LGCGSGEASLDADGDVDGHRGPTTLAARDDLRLLGGQTDEHFPCWLMFLFLFQFL
jgi:hypothetical protein